MFKEDVVEVGKSYFFRTVLKTRCDKPVGYAVAMYQDDWTINMEHAYSDMEMLGCIVTPEDEEIVECLIRATPQHPITGWQLKPNAYGVHWAYKVDLY